jgi:hypothetical protein
VATSPADWAGRGCNATMLAANAQAPSVVRKLCLVRAIW